MTRRPDSSDISVCIATYKRREMLDALLSDLAAQTLRPRQVVVVDNDAAGSARDVVEGHRQALAGIEVTYAVQPEKNISLTRNLAVSLARHDWVAFIDDDERAPADWLSLMHATAIRYDADGVQAPVLAILPDHAPDWIRRGDFYGWARFPTGTVVPRNVMRIGNYLLAGHWLRRQEQVFSPAYGLSGGEDGDLLMRLAGQGARMVWCDEACVTEPVADNRMRLSWLCKRALRGGQDYALHFRAGKLDHRPGLPRRILFFGRALAQMIVAGLLALCALPLGRHRAAAWLVRAYANWGKLSTLWGGRHIEYA
ncbi:glycosyltransferase family 2 protein [Achromobacter aloeverae]|uniref:Capsular biosynthesis protein n=1 Tax=Achromobacter aloeverae TaxID=1750518 RepID=A0A4Q1HGZ0_9BURK|nr:glycosyltransferase family 2 protein [Achromobacter aloeverae]RXN86629.1 capsular biosynthesis protein [Achromobacter aloeverae]